MPPQPEGTSQQPPSGDSPVSQRTEQRSLYTPEAIDFVRRGLSFTVQRVHAALTDPEASRHVTGRQLCEGLRDLALAQWGLMARIVLARWNVHYTNDFGRIVFDLVEQGELSRTDEDNVEDFKSVFDFSKAFDAAYQLDPAAVRRALASSRS